MSRQAIHKHVSRGLIPLIDGKIDLDAARVLLEDQLDPTRSKIHLNAHQREVTMQPAQEPPPRPAGASASPPPGVEDPQQDTPTSYHVARTLRESYEAKRAKLAYEQESGKLVEAADVKTAAAEIAAIVAIGLDSLPARLVHAIRAAADDASAEQICETECDRIRAELAEAAAALLQVKNA